MSKKILFTSTILQTVDAFLIPHLQFFLEKGFEVGVATNTESKDVSHLEIMGVHIHPVSYSRSPLHFRNIRAFFQIRKHLKHYDILHTHTPISSFLSRIASSKHHTTIYMSHGLHFNEHGNWLTNRLFKWAEKLAGWKTTRLIVTNTEDITQAESLVPKEKVRYVHGVGVDPTHYLKSSVSESRKARIKRSLGIEKNYPVLLHIAEFNANKRQVDSVLAVCELRKSYPDVMLLLIGKGENELAIHTLIEEKNVSESVKCLGFRKDIPQLLSICDIGLLLSLREGLPRSVMEMMCMKVPVVATDIRGNRDLIEHGSSGYLVPVKAPLQVAKSCRKLLERQDSSNFGHKGLQRIYDHFSLEHVLKELDAIYLELDLYAPSPPS